MYYVLSIGFANIFSHFSVTGRAWREAKPAVRLFVPEKNNLEEVLAHV
jgi:hypothetical protein